MTKYTAAAPRTLRLVPHDDGVVPNAFMAYRGDNTSSGRLIQIDPAIDYKNPSPSEQRDIHLLLDMMDAFEPTSFDG